MLKADIKLCRRLKFGIEPHKDFNEAWATGCRYCLVKNFNPEDGEHLNRVIFSLAHVSLVESGALIYSWMEIENAK